MPPGANVRDIPGNRPEDEALEAFYDRFYTAWEKAKEGCKDTEDFMEKIAQWVSDEMGVSYQMGYQDGMADEAMAQEAKRQSDE